MSGFTGLPDDESPQAIQDTYEESLRTSLPGWERSDGAIEVAEGAAYADEASVLYSLLRQDATDMWRSFGESVEGLAPIDAVPANSSTTWIANDGLEHTIDAGTELAMTTPAGVVTIETVFDATIPAGGYPLAGVIVQAVDTGSTLNGATGDLALDEPPTWLASVTLDAPLSGGADAEDDDAYDQRLARIRRNGYSRVVVLPEDVQALGMDITGIDRMLVIEGYDDSNNTSNVPLMMSCYPIDDAGANAGPTAVQTLRDELALRRATCTTVRIGTPTRTVVDVAIVVAALADADDAAIEAGVRAAIAGGTISPSVFGQPDLGELRIWELRRTVHRYQVAGDAAAAPGVQYVDSLTLNGLDADVHLAGAAPLPQLGACVVTVISAS